MLRLGGLEGSRYIRSTSMICAQEPLTFNDFSQLRIFTADEATKLADQIRRHNLFARQVGDDHFYIQRVKALAGRTIIEVFRAGDPKSIGEEAEDAATRIERIVVLSSTIALKKSDLLRRLGITSRIAPEINLSIGPGFYFLRSRAKRHPAARGIVVDQTFQKRFVRCGFPTLADYIIARGDMADRIRSCLDWLFDSRRASASRLIGEDSHCSGILIDPRRVRATNTVIIRTGRIHNLPYTFQTDADKPNSEEILRSQKCNRSWRPKAEESTNPSAPRDS